MLSRYGELQFLLLQVAFLMGIIMQCIWKVGKGCARITLYSYPDIYLLFLTLILLFDFCFSLDGTTDFIKCQLIFGTYWGPSKIEKPMYENAPQVSLLSCVCNSIPLCLEESTL